MTFIPKHSNVEMKKGEKERPLEVLTDSCCNCVMSLSSSFNNIFAINFRPKYLLEKSFQQKCYLSCGSDSKQKCNSQQKIRQNSVAQHFFVGQTLRPETRAPKEQKTETNLTLPDVLWLNDIDISTVHY